MNYKELKNKIKTGVFSDYDLIQHLNFINSCISNENYELLKLLLLNNNLIVFMNNSLNGYSYYKMNINTLEIKIYKNLTSYGDGHMSCFGNLILSDTYPNKSRLKELFIYNSINKSIHKIGEFYESLFFNEQTRCDLHPRFSYDGNKIFIDSVHDGKRRLYLIEKK